MGFEAGIKTEEEKKKKEKSEKQKKAEMQKIIEQEKRKKEAREKQEEINILHKLEEMLEDGELSQDEIKELKQIVESNDISEKQIEEILNKIEEIEEIEDVNNYLPKEFRIKKDEYKQSLTDNIIRLKTLTKLSTALTMLAEQINPDSSVGMNLFSGYLIILDNKLIKVQENTIDVKESLEKIENKKNKKNNKLSLGKKIILFFKELIK